MIDSFITCLLVSALTNLCVLCAYTGGAMYLHMTSVILLARDPDLSNSAMILQSAIDFSGSYSLLQLIKSRVKERRRHMATPKTWIKIYPTTPEAFNAEHPDVFEKAFRCSNAGPMKAQHAHPYIYIYIYI